jgi:hypothetical protein
MRTYSGPRFGGLYVSSVAAGILLAFGIELLVATVNEPLSAVAVSALNFAIRTTRVDTMLLVPPSFSWVLLAYTGFSGAIALFLGIRLAGWASRRSPQEASTSQRS